MSLVNIILYIRMYIDLFIDFIFGCYYDTKRKRVTAPKSPLLLESATSLARKIREKKITSEEVVRLFVERIKEVNPLLNAVVDERFEDALEEAKNVDQDIASGKITENDFDRKPFLGVPFTSKDTTIAKGMKATFGLTCRKNIVGEEDADIVDLLKKAGGILLGVTNVPILSMWQETNNNVYGRTNNPYDTTRNVGGSSGGEGAIIAACGSPFGIGTDIGGSIRIPAFMCGLFGYKPSNDLISTKGMTYRNGTEGPTMVTAGTITRCTEDIIPFLKVLLNENINKLKLDQKVDVKNLQMYYALGSRDLKISPLTKEMQKMIYKTITHFKEISTLPPKKLDLPNLKYGGNLWRYWLSQENFNFLKNLTDRKSEVSPMAEIFKYVICRSKFNIGTMFLLAEQFLPKINEKWARKVTEQLKTELLAKLGDNGVLLYPSAPYSARYHDVSCFRPWNFNYFATWNALKLPVMQVPLGLDAEGLPVGIQVVAAPYQDHLCIAVAKELEKTFGGYVPPFDVTK